MIHPKMGYTYVGIDSHKDTHTAVFMDCFFEKLGEITFDNMPSKFESFLRKAKKFQMENTVFMFGMEDVSVYGRLLTLFFKENKQQVKHVNALLVARERKNQNITQKTDSVDAECAARVLLSKFSELPDANPQDNYWILRTLVVRRDILVRHNTASKNLLHNLLTQHYPNYRNFFVHIDCNTSLSFYEKYPSPESLNGVSVDELTVFLRDLSNRQCGQTLAEEILNTRQDTTAESQEVRDTVVQSVIRQIRFNLEEIQRIDESIKDFLATFDCTLISMTGIDVVSAAQILSCIGDINRFPTPAKLARYAGIAPVTYASGKKDLQFANQRGNRELNAHLYKLAVRLTMTVGCTNKVINSFFYDYYHRKLTEGKTKRQALKCVQRRLVNIIWTMLTHGEEYVNPPTFDLPEEAEVNFING
jgi:transposase